MTKRITAKGGPLNGKTVLVHDTQDAFTHHADTGGHYKVNQKTATWQQAPKSNTKPDADTEG